MMEILHHRFRSACRQDIKDRPSSALKIFGNAQVKFFPRVIDPACGTVLELPDKSMLQGKGVSAFWEKY